jgi:hypothetical protein
MEKITNAKMAAFKALSQQADFDAFKGALKNKDRNRNSKYGRLNDGVIYETNPRRILEANGIRNETDKYNKIFKENVAYNKDFEEKLQKAKSGIVTVDKNKWASGALGLGTAAALGGYYISNRDKRWRDKDGKIDKTKAAKDLGKAGLAGAGAYLAGRALETSIMNNTNAKLANFHNSNRISTGPVRKDLYEGFDKIYKDHGRNLALGFGGLAAAGIGGYALHRYLKRKKEKSEDKKSQSK